MVPAKQRYHKEILCSLYQVVVQHEFIWKHEGEIFRGMPQLLNFFLAIVRPNKAERTCNVQKHEDTNVTAITGIVIPIT